MNARELLEHINNGCDVVLVYQNMDDIIKPALSLLAAAQENDGKTPNTDVNATRSALAIAGFARSRSDESKGTKPVTGRSI